MKPRYFQHLLDKRAERKCRILAIANSSLIQRSKRIEGKQKTRKIRNQILSFFLSVGLPWIALPLSAGCILSGALAPNPTIDFNGNRKSRPRKDMRCQCPCIPVPGADRHLVAVCATWSKPSACALLQMVQAGRPRHRIVIRWGPDSSPSRDSHSLAGVPALLSRAVAPAQEVNPCLSLPFSPRNLSSARPKR